LKVPEEVTILEPTSPPIPRLKLMDGVQYDECEYACPSELNTIKHCKTEHEWVKAKGLKWEAQKVQTFFPSNKRRYFIIVELHEKHL